MHSVGVNHSWSVESAGSVSERFQAKTLKRDFKTSEVIRAPPGMDRNMYFRRRALTNRWIYEKALFYLEECRLLFESYSLRSCLTRRISDHCTPQTCPEMTAGPHYTYLWTDEMHRDPISVSLLLSCNRSCPPATTFQTRSSGSRTPFRERISAESRRCLLLASRRRDGRFPDDFLDVMKIAFKKLFRVYAHVYHHHLSEFVGDNAEVYLNTSFKYFGLFVREYNLISMKEEAPLRKLLQRCF